MINQELRPNEENIMCCLVLGFVTGNERGSKLLVIAHMCAVAALSSLLGFRHVEKVHERLCF